MNLNKHIEFFDPVNIKDPIHIIGVGAIGSTVAEMLARLGFAELHLYDFDTVADYNITNQMFRFKDIGALKVDAAEEILKEINPDIRIKKFPKGWLSHMPLSGYVILAVDSIAVRQEVVQTNRYNQNIKGMFDFRMRLTDAQHFGAVWSNSEHVDTFWDGMQFTQEEAAAATPLSACGTSLSVTPTVRVIVGLGVANMIHLMKDEDIHTVIMCDAFTPNIVEI